MTMNQNSQTTIAPINDTAALIEQYRQAQRVLSSTDTHAPALTDTQANTAVMLVLDASIQLGRMGYTLDERDEWHAPAAEHSAPAEDFSILLAALSADDDAQYGPDDRQLQDLFGGDNE